MSITQYGVVYALPGAGREEKQIGSDISNALDAAPFVCIEPGDSPRIRPISELARIDRLGKGISIVAAWLRAASPTCDPIECEISVNPIKRSARTVIRIEVTTSDRRISYGNEWDTSWLNGILSVCKHIDAYFAYVTSDVAVELHDSLAKARSDPGFEPWSAMQNLPAQFYDRTVLSQEIMSRLDRRKLEELTSCGEAFVESVSSNLTMITANNPAGVSRALGCDFAWKAQSHIRDNQGKPGPPCSNSNSCEDR